MLVSVCGPPAPLPMVLLLGDVVPGLMILGDVLLMVLKLNMCLGVTRERRGPPGLAFTFGPAVQVSLGVGLLHTNKLERGRGKAWC